MREDLSTLLTKAINRLQEATKALADKDEKMLSYKVWKAASDVEYATFLMALSRQSENDAWKERRRVSRPLDIAVALLNAQDLLRKAVKALNSDIEEGYRDAWFARGHILDIQNGLDKDRIMQSRPQRPAQ